MNSLDTTNFDAVQSKDREILSGPSHGLMRASSREFLIDISRLIWRVWRGGLPTGIDRVCLAYVEHFGRRSQAVVQRRGLQLILSPKHSDRLFALLLRGGPRRALLRLAVTAWRGARRSAPQPAMIYFNIGHTGLDEPALPTWVARNRIRAIYLIHDLIPVTHPEFCRAGEREKHVARIENVLSSAHAVIGNSQSTITELNKFAADRGARMPVTVTAWISGSKMPSDVAPRALPRPHFVTVGTIEARKNHILLLQIWRRLVLQMGPDAPYLLIIGQRGWEAGPAISMLDRAAELKDRVVELGKCGDGELAEWLGGARALLMPSFAEGFGLPIIEALQMGVPVIASDLSVFREIAGGTPTYLDPLDRLAWEKTIRSFMNDDPERARQVTQLRAFRSPDWASHFAVVERLLDDLGAA